MQANKSSADKEKEEREAVRNVDGAVFGIVACSGQVTESTPVLDGRALSKMLGHRHVGSVVDPLSSGRRRKGGTRCRGSTSLLY